MFIRVVTDVTLVTPLAGGGETRLKSIPALKPEERLLERLRKAGKAVLCFVNDFFIGIIHWF